MIKKPKRFYVYNNFLHFNYRLVYTKWNNPFFDNKLWNCWEEYSIFIGFNKKLIGYENFYYDGMTLQSITLLFFTIGLNFSYTSEELK